MINDKLIQASYRVSRMLGLSKAYVDTVHATREAIEPSTGGQVNSLVMVVSRSVDLSLQSRVLQYTYGAFTTRRI
jgi:hypothetical protein